MAVYGEDIAALAGRSARCATSWWTSTGNTHRSRVLHRQALLARQQHAGRLGLLELRAFEMPPHARMSHRAQQLLLRALVARFWQRALRAGAAGALGHRAARPLPAAAASCSMDFEDVIEETGAAPATASMLSLVRAALRVPLPQGARRASAAQRRRTSTLRNALEHWHVMGEEGAAGGTVRYVDSSLERIAAQGQRLGRSTRHVHHLSTAVTAAAAATPAAPASTWPACATALGIPPLGPAPHHRRACAAGVRPGRHLDAALAGRAASTTSPIRAAATTRRLPVNSYEAESRRLARFFGDRVTRIGAGRDRAPPRPTPGVSRSRWTCAALARHDQMREAPARTRGLHAGLRGRHDARMSSSQKPAPAPAFRACVRRGELPDPVALADGGCTMAAHAEGQLSAQDCTASAEPARRQRPSCAPSCAKQFSSIIWPMRHGRLAGPGRPSARLRIQPPRARGRRHLQRLRRPQGRPVLAPLAELELLPLMLVSSARVAAASRAWRDSSVRACSTPLLADVYGRAGACWARACMPAGAGVRPHPQYSAAHATRHAAAGRRAPGCMWYAFDLVRGADGLLVGGGPSAPRRPSGAWATCWRTA